MCFSVKCVHELQNKTKVSHEDVVWNWQGIVVVYSRHFLFESMLVENKAVIINFYLIHKKKKLTMFFVNRWFHTGVNRPSLNFRFSVHVLCYPS